jgi:hypothetical protein
LHPSGHSPLRYASSYCVFSFNGRNITRSSLAELRREPENIKFDEIIPLALLLSFGKVSARSSLGRISIGFTREAKEE